MDHEAKSLGGLLDSRVAELEEENAMLRERCEVAGYMIEMARLSMFGVSGDGTNALAPRVIMEWARKQIEATPGAVKYYSVAFEHPAAPDISVVVCIQRRDKETPAGRAARLAEEVERLRAVITKAVDDLPEWSDGALKHLSPTEVMADEVRTALRAAVTR